MNTDPRYRKPGLGLRNAFSNNNFLEFKIFVPGSEVSNVVSWIEDSSSIPCKANISKAKIKYNQR